MRYVYIHTFGCQMNVHDSEQMAEILKKEGYLLTEDMNKADLIIVNTCSVREKAEQKAHSQIGRFKRLKKAKPALRIGVAGCLAQQWKDDIFTKSPFVDIVVGTHNLHRLPELVKKVREGGPPVVETAFRERAESVEILASPRNGSVAAYVTVMQGCDNFCSFCVVPYLRGREVSRDVKDILREVEFLVDRGVKEVTLLGQNVNGYGKTLGHGTCFSGLLKKIGKIKKIERIRFTTSHPRDLSDDIIRCFGEIEALCEHVHLPVQSGSNRILERMNRGYSREDYLEKVARLRSISPSISISTDVIVGFPGEEEGDYQGTLDLMEAVRFDSLFSFKYSDRPGTKAMMMPEKINEEEKGKRLARLQALQETYTMEKNKAFEGSHEMVLVEGISKNSEEDVMGRTRTNRIVNFHGDDTLIGKMIPVKIKRAYLHSLRGEMDRGKEVQEC